MGLTAAREITVRSADGSSLVVTATDKIETATTFVVRCDGPRCGSRAVKGEPASVSWIEEKIAQGNPMPDAFFSLVKLVVNPDKPQEYSFCGPQCARDYLQYTYVPPQPPRIALENAKREQAKELSELNPHLKTAKKIVDAAPTLRKAFADPQIVEGLEAMGQQVDYVTFEDDVRAAKELVQKTDESPALCQADGDPGEAA